MDIDGKAMWEERALGERERWGDEKGKSTERRRVYESG